MNNIEKAALVVTDDTKASLVRAKIYSDRGLSNISFVYRLNLEKLKEELAEYDDATEVDIKIPMVVNGETISAIHNDKDMCQLTPIFVVLHTEKTKELSVTPNSDNDQITEEEIRCAMEWFETQPS